MRSVATTLGIALALLGCDSAEDVLDPDAATTAEDGGLYFEDAGATDDAGAPGADAGAETDAGPLPEGRVPMFVAYGHAARTLTSCDGGETWIGEHSFEADGHDHSPYSGLGRMTYGDGRFLGCAGWGNPTRVIYSEDGLAWEDLPDESFVLEGGDVERPRQGCSGITWDGARYALVAGSRLFTSPDGRAWTRHPDALPGSDNVRAVGGGDGLIIYIRGGAYLSGDGGDSWYQGSGYDPECSNGVQRGGGIHVTGDRVVIGGRAGTVCVSEDRGESWSSTYVTDMVRFLAYSGSEYVLTARSGEIHRSPDARSWTRVDHDAGVELAAIAFMDGAWVGVACDAMSFFVSDDATSWRAATSEGTDSDYLWTIVAGYGRPSARCPRP